MNMTIKRQFLFFCIRWFINSVGLWVAAKLLSSGIDYSGEWASLVLGGLFLSIINTILRPVIVILSLPAILLTLGLFTIVVNGIMVYIAAALTPGLHISFGAAILTGLIIGLMNYALSGVIELQKEAKR